MTMDSGSLDLDRAPSVKAKLPESGPAHVANAADDELHHRWWRWLCMVDFQVTNTIDDLARLACLLLGSSLLITRKVAC